MNIIKSVWNWVVFSSANPQKLSLTLKAIIPALVFFGLGDSELFSGAIESVVHFISMTVAYTSTAVATFGALRKVFNSVFAKKTS